MTAMRAGECGLRAMQERLLSGSLITTLAVAHRGEIDDSPVAFIDGGVEKGYFNGTAIRGFESHHPISGVAKRLNAAVSKTPSSLIPRHIFAGVYPLASNEMKG